MCDVAERARHERRKLGGQRQAYADDDAIAPLAIGRTHMAAMKSGDQANDVKAKAQMRLFAFLFAPH